MSLLVCLYKPKKIKIIRYYSVQRNKPSHYDILRIPKNSSQKEIKKAFIKLSKEMHPDCSGRKSHEDFVKINEAYRVLSKADTRMQYDTDLKYGVHTEYSVNNKYKSYQRPYNRRYETRRQWEARMAGAPPPYETYNTIRKPYIGIGVCLLLAIVGTLIQFALINYSITFRRDTLTENSRKYSLQYKEIRAAAGRKTLDEQIATIFKNHDLSFMKSEK